MNIDIKSLAALAATVIATTSFAAGGAEKSCGANSSCAKKEQIKDASCSKKDSSCSKKEASCSKKDASCSKKEASCSKK